MRSAGSAGDSIRCLGLAFYPLHTLIIEGKWVAGRHDHHGLVAVEPAQRRFQIGIINGDQDGVAGGNPEATIIYSPLYHRLETGGHYGFARIYGTDLYPLHAQYTHFTQTYI